MNLLQLASLCHDKVSSVAFLQDRGVLHRARTCLNGHPMTLSLEPQERWRCMKRECRQDTHYGRIHGCKRQNDHCRRSSFLYTVGQRREPQWSFAEQSWRSQVTLLLIGTTICGKSAPNSTSYWWTRTSCGDRRILVFEAEIWSWACSSSTMGVWRVLPRNQRVFSICRSGSLS